MKKIAMIACIIMLSGVGFMMDLGPDISNKLLQAADVNFGIEQFEIREQNSSQVLDKNWDV